MLKSKNRVGNWWGVGRTALANTAMSDWIRISAGVVLPTLLGPTKTLRIPFSSCGSYL
jgi:hypothetical protein